MAMQRPAAARALAVFVIWLAVVGWTVGDPQEDLQCNQIVFQASATLRLAASCTGIQPAEDCEQQCKRRIADLIYGIARKEPDICFFINHQFDWDIRIQNICWVLDRCPCIAEGPMRHAGDHMLMFGGSGGAASSPSTWTASSRSVPDSQYCKPLAGTSLVLSRLVRRLSHSK
ncbi:hypothetical protein BCR37DRAFT_386478 [Protomyces lactucae-debilis]|uniref:Extracellular membrane protein CFEM domain-containing protein n=1 Tax=Protomyces lactucae-debilis TaxID=2754530 RepID=A0A1Y2FL28_PROLT|nr:uncharacterized protein BCR37DRAFT_386478 [Protomyces lactucae-debilis]ORY84287.1 hypothetical protein BCR37DRAFT_386478 [Protomyces lactucae-debilis]